MPSVSNNFLMLYNSWVGKRVAIVKIKAILKNNVIKNDWVRRKKFFIMIFIAPFWSIYLIFSIESVKKFM